MCPSEHVNYQNKLYWVYRRVKQHHMLESDVQELKEYWHCDIVLKHKNQVHDFFLFLREIPELELVE
jgi:hypothetical protein